jgi:hypothetical protein
LTWVRPGNAQDNIRLDGVFGSIGKTDIREHIAAALCDSDCFFHSLSAKLSASFNLRLIFSISVFGVEMPFLDFF